MSLEDRDGATDQQHAFLSEVFHSLSQPMTALQCSLELALLRDQTPAEFRSSLEAALRNAERLRQRLMLVRELSQSDDPGDTSSPVELAGILQEVCGDLAPVAESHGTRFIVSCEPLPVRGSIRKLSRAFFYLFEFLLRTARCAPIITVCVQPDLEQDGVAEIRVSGFGTTETPPPNSVLVESSTSQEVEIARRTFRAVGGDLLPVSDEESSTGWRIRLLLAV